MLFHDYLAENQFTYMRFVKLCDFKLAILIENQNMVAVNNE